MKLGLCIVGCGNFAKTFANTHTWQTWAETFPIHLVEMTSHGNEKIRNKKMIQQGAVL